MTLKRLLVLTGLIFILFTGTAMTTAQQTARVYLRPVMETETTLIADVIVENVTQLYGIDFEILFDPSLLTVQDAVAFQNGIQIEPGSLFPKSDSFVITNQVDPQQGIISFAAVMIHPAPPIDQGGMLARLTFDRVQPAPLALQFKQARLISSDLQQQVPLQTVTLLLDSHLPQNADTMSAAAVPKKNFGDTFPWWLVATLIVVLGLLTLGGYLLLNNGHATRPPKPIRLPESETAQIYPPAKSTTFDNSHSSPV